MKAREKPTQCSEMVFGDRVQAWQCTRNATVYRGRRWYCRQHDPEAAQARQKARDSKYRAARDEESAINAEAARLANALGVVGHAQFRPQARYSEVGYARCLVISFKDAERLIERLAVQGRKDQ